MSQQEITTDVEALKNYLRSLERCCLKHRQNYAIDEIVSVEAWIESENDGPAGGALFNTASGKFGAMEESQDYTGHGCQCSSQLEIFETREEAIRLGLTPQVRERLNLK